jgi:hypothetical protein
VPTFISGLPMHVLIVHAVVVLVPLAALGALVISFWPAARSRYGWLVLAVAALATATIPIATSTGEGLEHNLPRTAAIAAHTALGDELLPLAGLLVVTLVALLVTDHYRATTSRRSGPGTVIAPTAALTWVRPLALGLSVITFIVAVVTTVQVVRIGDSGARAAWGDQQYVQQARPNRSGEDG